MKLATIAAILLLLAPTTASAVVITKLGAGPILTPSNSRAALVDKIRTTERFATAEKDLGLNAVQIRQFNERLPKANYVTLPRHLDEMAYYSNGVKILRDVTIPAETKGWALDVTGAHIFIPQACSNISVVFVRRGVAATIVHAPLVVAAPPSPAPIPTPSLTPAPTPAPTPTPAAAPPVAPVTHHTSGWFGLLLLPLFFIHSGGDTDTHALSPPIYAPTPTHKPTTTPTPVPTKTPCPTPTPCPTKTR